MQSKSDTQNRRPVVLCIDDDPQITEAITLRLRPFDVDVQSAYHGMHGFWLAMTEHPDVVITDVRMPQGNGDYVVECLRNNSDTANVPVIVLTGQRDATLESRMRKLGVADFHNKPVHFEELLQSLAELIPLHERETIAATASV